MARTCSFSSLLSASSILLVLSLQRFTSSASLPPSSFNPLLKYSEVRRIVDLSSRVAKVTLEGVLTSPPSAPPIAEFHLVFPAFEATRIGHIVVSATAPFSGAAQLTVSHNGHLVPIPSSSSSSTVSAFSKSSPVGLSTRVPSTASLSSHGYVYTVTPPSSSPFIASGGGDFGFTLVYYLGHAYEPLPRELGITDRQFVEFTTTSLFLSPYPTLLQSTAYKLPAGHNLQNQDDECIRQMNPSSADVYVSPDYANNPPFTVVPSSSSPCSSVRFHFRLEKHLGHFRQVERYVEVSHWGNVFFHEHYQLTNAAARLKGEFNRVQYSQAVGETIGRRRTMADWPASHIIFELEAALPRRAFGLEYFDRIGNVSSSVASRQGAGPTYTSLKVEPRYPLMGGWNADWQIQYNVPIRSVLGLDKDDGGNRHYLNVTFGSPFRGVFVDEMITRVALPAGAHNIKISTPRQLDGNWTEHRWSWLDLVQPRPVVGLYVHNYYVPERDLLQHKFQICYDYSPTVSDIQKPLLLCCLIFLPFLFWIVKGRLNLRIAGKEEGDKFDRIELRASIRSHALEVYEDLTHCSDDFIAALEKFELQPIRHLLEEAKEKWKRQYDDLAIKADDMISQLEPPDAGLMKVAEAIRKFGKATDQWVDSRQDGKRGMGPCTIVEEAEMYLLKLLDLDISRKGKME
eukprot:GHVS01019561.1.p1 GENE.GHVS01019561.1~~GHVS01019561.1.p1  ORF type:complete len:684 (+),score=112.63 GHVS01019561.1:76-2127(+)